MKNKILLVAAVLIFLSGCVTAGPDPVPKAFQDIPLDEAGIAFGTIGSDLKSSFTRMGIRYRQVDSENESMILFQQGYFSISPLNFEVNGEKGSVFVLQLPPGQYEMYDVYFHMDQASAGSTTFSSKQEFSVPFEIKKGESVYLGEFITKVVKAKNFLRISVPVGGYFKVTDQLERDKAYLLEQNSEISSEAIRSDVLNPSEQGLIVFRA